MLRELNKNEMETVSGGFGDDLPPDGFGGQQWEWDWAQNDSLVMAQMTGGYVWGSADGHGHTDFSGGGGSNPQVRSHDNGNGTVTIFLHNSWSLEDNNGNVVQGTPAGNGVTAYTSSNADSDAWGDNYQNGGIRIDGNLIPFYDRIS